MYGQKTFVFLFSFCSNSCFFFAVSSQFWFISLLTTVDIENELQFEKNYEQNVRRELIRISVQCSCCNFLCFTSYINLFLRIELSESIDRCYEEEK